MTLYRGALLLLEGNGHAPYLVQRETKERAIEQDCTSSRIRAFVVNKSGNEVS